MYRVELRLPVTIGIRIVTVNGHFTINAYRNEILRWF